MATTRKPLRVLKSGPVTSQPPDRAMMGVHIFNDAARGVVISRTWDGPAGSLVDDVLLSALDPKEQDLLTKLLDKLGKVPMGA